MSKVRASIRVAGRRIVQIEELWYDRARWPSFVDGMKHVYAIEGDHPHAGSVVKWESFPGGRGRVLEKVVTYEPREGQQLDVQDGQIHGLQTLRFESLDDGAVRISLELEYEIRQRSTFTPLVDLLFVRRAQTDSLRRTLVRFARELDAEPTA